MASYVVTIRPPEVSFYVQTPLSDSMFDQGHLRLVYEAMGHEELVTTRIFTHIVIEELEEAMKNFRKERG